MNKPLLAATDRLLRPLVRILLRNGVPYGVFADIAKRVYVDVAGEESGIPGKKQTVSRISVITGLSRREVGRVKNLPSFQEMEADQRYNRAARVIGGWIRDERFLDSNKMPKDLPLEGRGASFSELVRQFSGNIPVRAILDELLRVGAAERLSDNKVRLLVRAYLPKTDKAGMLDILGTDVKDLISTIDHNLRMRSQESFFQRKVAYDNLPSEIIEELRRLSASRGQTWLEEMDRWLAQHDRDMKPSVRGGGRVRAGIGIYYFEEELDKGGTNS
jgi:hypothetical protein